MYGSAKSTLIATIGMEEGVSVDNGVSRKQAQNGPHSESVVLNPPEVKEMEKAGTIRRQVGIWRTSTVILGIVCVGLIVAVVVLVTRESTSEPIPMCGVTANSAQNPNYIDLSEPAQPGPFHDLTKHELRQLRSFLEKDRNIKAEPTETIKMSTSYIYLMDLYPANKAAVLDFLDKDKVQPPRQARVIMYRGDKTVPVVEEYICGPLPNVQQCDLLKSPTRRNPVEYSLRPVGFVEFAAVHDYVLKEVDRKVGYILKESYGTSYYDCPTRQCFVIYPSPLATNLVGNITQRRLWLWADYPVEYYILHPVDFGVLAVLDGSNPEQFRIDKLWYHGQLYNSVDELISFYNSSSDDQKSRIKPHTHTKDTFSTLNLRGNPLPKKPLRPPTQVEPDGKRYTLKDRKVDYLGWNFNFRMSALTGPSIYDVRYNGERLAFELGLSEIAVFYSGNNPLQRVTDFVDSGALIGTHSKALVPGGDCPESATFINQTFSGQSISEPAEVARAFCLFENNNGYPLRRHLSYAQTEGAFYGGMLDSVLVLRCALTVINYDYILDFIFHQNGVIETRIMSTGYIFPTFFTRAEQPYGFRIEDQILGTIHHHLFHFKADLDISGTSNRYETLDILPEEVDMRQVPGRKYHQIKYEKSLKTTEKDALFKYNFDSPKYHVVHNEAKKTKHDEIKAYRLAIMGMSKQLLPEEVDNERTIPWARHQLVVTKRKEDEQISSSPYAMWDSLNPVTNFTTFYADDESIVDEDLVFWINLGLHHIPHTEDLPLTPTVGNHLTFFLLPYNYFDECPSVASRDHIRIDLKNPDEPKQGVKVERNGNSYDTCSLPQVAKEYDELLKGNPDVVVESQHFRGIY